MTIGAENVQRPSEPEGAEAGHREPNGTKRDHDDAVDAAVDADAVDQQQLQFPELPPALDKSLAPLEPQSPPGGGDFTDNEFDDPPFDAEVIDVDACE